MGLISTLLSGLFGSGRNVVAETAQVFRENSEASATRDVAMRSQALGQYAREFSGENASRFDRLMDGLNRIPRPALALGTLGLFVAAMVDPIWFASRMQGISLVPEPLWWLLGAIVSFYFGARHQIKSQEFQKSIAATMARTPEVVENIAALKTLGAISPGVARTEPDADLSLGVMDPGTNEALVDWKARHLYRDKP